MALRSVRVDVIPSTSSRCTWEKGLLGPAHQPLSSSCSRTCRRVDQTFVVSRAPRAPLNPAQSSALHTIGHPAVLNLPLETLLDLWVCETQINRRVCKGPDREEIPGGSADTREGLWHAPILPLRWTDQMCGLSSRKERIWNTSARIPSRPT